MKDRNILAAGQLGGETGRVQFARNRCEADQVVYDYVEGATYTVARNVGEIQSFGEDALAGESAIAVNQQWDELVAAAFTFAVLLGASAADGYGINSLKMAGIRNQVNMNFGAAAGDVLAGSAHVIFHVAATENAARVHVFESRENFFWGAPGDIHHDIEATAMAHADN